MWMLVGTGYIKAVSKISAVWRGTDVFIIKEDTLGYNDWSLSTQVNVRSVSTENCSQATIWEKSRSKSYFE